MTKGKTGLRTGYTTGACAAAAAKAATTALLARRECDTVEISLPAGGTAIFQVQRVVLDADQALCCVIKDAGDDPDVTNGAEICATVRRVVTPGLAIRGGEGVGVVTKPGLGLAIGSPAINPVPMKMIAESVREVIEAENSSAKRRGEPPCSPGGEEGPDHLVNSANSIEKQGIGLEVTISVPRGAQIAKKTLNERLGIVGGISILGTTGIVRPFSTSAYKACIAQALDVAAANGCDRVVLTTGGRTEKFAQGILSLPQEAFVQMGDFVGFALRQSAAKGMREVTIAAMVGKLSKIAAGNFETHVSKSRVDASFLAGVASACGLEPSVVDEIERSNTARHFSEIVLGNGAGHVFTRLCELACAESGKHVRGKVSLECILTGFDGQLLGRARTDV